MKIAAISLLLLVTGPTLAQAPARPVDGIPAPTAAASSQDTGAETVRGETVRGDQTASSPKDQPPAPVPALAAPVSPPEKAETPGDKAIVCFSAREANDRIARLRLYNPLVAMQASARRLRAEPLRSRLCRAGGQLIYELSLIRKEGRVLRIHLNAQTGRPIASPRN